MFKLQILNLTKIINNDFFFILFIKLLRSAYYEWNIPYAQFFFLQNLGLK